MPKRKITPPIKPCNSPTTVPSRITPTWCHPAIPDSFPAYSPPWRKVASVKQIDTTATITKKNQKSSCSDLVLRCWKKLRGRVKAVFSCALIPIRLPFLFSISFFADLLFIAGRLIHLFRQHQILRRSISFYPTYLFRPHRLNGLICFDDTAGRAWQQILIIALSVKCSHFSRKRIK